MSSAAPSSPVLRDLFQIDLEILGLADAGVPNSERVILRALRPVNLAGFGIGVGIFISDGQGAWAVNDNVFWFPEFHVDPPAYIFVYTGAGTIKQTTVTTGEPALVFHWHRPSVIFNQELLVPILIDVGFARVGKRL